MAKTVSNQNQEFALKMLNTEEQQKLFTELQTSVQISVLNAAFKRAGKPIIDQAKSNFYAIKKDKSSDNYAGFDKAFKMTALKKDIGMIIGLKHAEGYKYRFIEYGTKERFTKGKGAHFTGVINPTKFFENAVEQKGEESQNMLSDEIVLSLERCVKRYDRKAGK